MANPLRSFLTTLGIIIGSLTIIVVVALGEGAKKDIEAQYSNMSVTTILINAPSTADGEKSKLDIKDIDALKEIQTVKLAVPQLSGRVQMQYEGKTSSLAVLGTLPDFEKLANLNVIQGKFFSQEDEVDRNKVAVIGAVVAEELFGSRSAKVVGKTITVGKKQFEIVGLISYKGGTVGPTTIDDSIFVPYTTASRYILGTSGRFNINVQAQDVASLPIAVEQISETLRISHNLKAGMSDDFRVRDMGATVSSAVDSSRTMSILLASVGIVVLLVGGIGIMNIMYVTVTERTREIGVRKAIGAKEEYILAQFLFEAFILSFVGYVVGAVISIGVYYLLLKLAVSVIMVWWSFLLSFLITMGIGVFFGYYPAKKASSLNPVDALRYE